MKKASILALALLLSAATYAQTWSADKAHTKLGFTVVHLGLSEVDGVFPVIESKITSSKEDFSDAVFELSAEVKSVNNECCCFVYNWSATKIKRRRMIKKIKFVKISYRIKF